MPRKATARKISYKAARSYRRTVPNPMGVTAIAAVNRSQAYARRYASARNILSGSRRTKRNRPAKKGERTLKQLGADMKARGFGDERILYSVASAAKARSMSDAEIRKEGYDPAKLPTLGRPAAPAKKKAATKAAPKEKKVARTTRKKTKKKVAKKKVAKKRVAKRRPAAKKKVAKKRVTKRRPAKKKVAKKKVTKRRPAAKKKVAKKRVTRRRPAKRKVAKKKTKRVIAMKKLSPEAKAAKKAKAAAAYVKKCEREARKAAREVKKKELRLKKARKTREDNKKRKARISKAGKKLRYRRTAKGRRVYPGGLWAPTVKITASQVKDAYVYQTRAGTLRKIPFHSLAGYATKRALKKVLDDKSAELSPERERITKLYDRVVKRREREAERMRKRGGIFVPNRRRGRAKTRALTFEEWESMKQNKRRRRRKRRKTSTKARKTYTRKNLSARQRAALAKGRRKAASRRKVRRNPVTQAAANKRRKRRKSSRKPRAVYRSYRRNQALAGSYQKQLMQALKLGGVITAGYLVHRALSKVVQQSVFANTQYGGLISGVLVAAVGVPLSVKVAPGDSKLVSAGMMVSLVQAGIMELLNVVDTNGSISQYLSGYGDRPGSMLSGMGSYYEFTPHQQFGEYMQTSGLGQLQQAAAGMGQIQQAAAGMGQLTQAAAGAGEYLAVGAEGIGEYEEVTPEYTRPIPVDEGISPDLSSAEHALSVSEAAAGVGGMGQYGGVPAMSTVNPTGYAMPVKDAPAGSRSGVFAGKGVFGPTS
jgi:hypothetical protein